ncbi:Uu.00g121920.m01.CDS01 [Anthostomella pinea]|uniref:Uu.00g121920.m01.CDS01 n=1 Tax=Anthostomella pinea TaxID=933095 RepID=A0AAI8YEY3_9PEZI|nr:Uu.00g121920.m01.CDS01 [Anthostomella pinea]
MPIMTINFYYLPPLALLIAIAGSAHVVLRGPLAKLPGPWYTAWTDVVLLYKQATGKKVTYVENLHRRYGPVVRITPRETSLRDPRVTRKIYSVKGEFPKSEFYDRVASGLVSVFSTRDIDVHRRFRRLLSSGISESSLLTHLPVIEGKVDMAIRRMGEEMQRREVADVFHWFLSMGTDIIGELSFGQSFEMLETGEESQYIRDLKTLAKFSGIRATFPFLIKLGHHVNIPFIKDAIENRRRTVEYAEQSIARHYRIVEEQGKEAKPTLLSKLYKAGDDGMAFHEIRANATAYIVAGSDTAANTLTYLVWMVCKHAEVKAKLVQELQQLPASYGYHDVKSLPYLNLVIDETLRLYSAAPAGLPRDVPAGGAEFLGYYIPAGYTVSTGAYSMHRNPAVFPDPERFEPSRWADPTRDMKDSFVPFGGGSRICLGIHLARMELRLAAARFFKTFPNARVSTAEGFCDEDMEPEMFFLLSPKSKRCLVEVS